MKLTLHDQRQLIAAEGWLELGSWQDAQEELERITEEFQAHPAVLSVRYEIHAKARQWNGAAEIAGMLVKLLPHQPAFWVSLAYATRRKDDGGIPEAKLVLREARTQFPKDYLIAFNLACYECQLGNRKAAMNLLETAIQLAGKNDIRAMARADPDLEPLWNDISGV